MIIIAIDPGKTGAIAVSGQRVATQVYSMPKTPRDICGLLQCWPDLPTTPVKVFIEDVGFHVQGNNAVASCKFAKHVGQIEGILTALEVPFEGVKPVKWQKSIPNMPQRPKSPDIRGLSYGMALAERQAHRRLLAEHKRKCKNHIKDQMQRLYPQIKVTLVNADALGILTHALSLPQLQLQGG